jgi:Tol biopolymer transport system component/tRNA A-37 threonylcarbamoyl transferase component Bud32
MITMRDAHSHDDWTELASLVDALLDAPAERRAEVIAELSAGDESRRVRLEQLLVECEREPALLSRPAAERFAALLDDSAVFPASLAERYRPERELGRGGMATVYLARDLKHVRDVAVKIVHPAVASALGPERFLREIEIVAQLHHPHIVPLYDSGNAQGALYFVMPYEPGGSLRQRLDRDGPLPVDEAVLILRDVCDALAYAHSHGIVHRDVKPDNVLLAGRHALVTDFGVARAIATPGARKTITAAGLAIGTPAYMAPEQIAGDPLIDLRTDIYAVGVMAYELLTGAPPFVRDTRQDVLAAHLTEHPAPIADKRPDVPAPLAGVVMKCLSKRAVSRWRSADELLVELDAHTSASISAEAARTHRPHWTRWIALTAASLALAIVAVVARDRFANPAAQWQRRWANARIERVTDFPGSEVDAAISPDGRLVAFLADRDSVFDAFVTRPGSEQFANLTAGRLPQLFNEDVRNVGFSADGSQVWLRVADISSPASVSVVPTIGGAPRPFLPTAVMVAWSPDGARLAYHETTPGDPIFVARADGSGAQRIFIAAPGLHGHHLAWSPDGRFIYFASGVPPNEMDIWRVPSSGGAAERITHHDSRVAYPALLDDRTLVYTATADDGTGPWLYTMDVQTRVPQRVSTGVEHYLSVAASAAAASGPRRLVATVSNPSVHLWSVPIGDSISGERDASAIMLPTARSAGPRFARDSSVYYLASRSGADGVWHLAEGKASEVWRPTSGGVIGAPAVSPDGQQVCFPVRRGDRTTLYCASADGTGARALTDLLDVRGAPSWSPDGRWITIAARLGDGVRVFKLPAEGGAPVQLVDSVSSNPVWSPDGRFIVYSGVARARSVPLRAVTPDGRPYPMPALTVDRVGDSYRFLPDGRTLVVKLGGFRHQDFWSFDVATGQKRQLTQLRAGASLQRFDVAPDGKRIVFERVVENSDIVMIELPEN